MKTDMNQTSLDIWHRTVKARAPITRQKVLAAIEEIQPCCNQEIAEHLRWPINSVTGRVKELRDDKKVVLCYRQPYKWGRVVNYWATPSYKAWEFPDVD